MLLLVLMAWNDSLSTHIIALLSRRNLCCSEGVFQCGANFFNFPRLFSSYVQVVLLNIQGIVMRVLQKSLTKHLPFFRVFERGKFHAISILCPDFYFLPQQTKAWVEKEEEFIALGCPSSSSFSTISAVWEGTHNLIVDNVPKNWWFARKSYTSG